MELLFLIYKIDLNRPFIYRIHKVGILNIILNNDNVKGSRLQVFLKEHSLFPDFIAFLVLFQNLIIKQDLHLRM